MNVQLYLKNLYDYLENEGKKKKEQLLKKEEISKLTINHFYYLEVIKDLEKPTFTDLANQLNVTRPSVSTMVKVLIEQGYINKDQSSEDGRVYFLNLTEKGKNLLKVEEEVIEEFIILIQEALTEEELEQMAVFLKKINNHL
ncbi:MAG: MarR family winged helix-turn-helix transcriptional regulator [Eubacteriales bacterium]